MQKITVTISKDMYDLLLHGRKATKELPGIKACNTHAELVRYVDKTFGLLGRVVDVLTD